MDDVRAYIRARGPRCLRLIKYKMLGPRSPLSKIEISAGM